MSIYSYMILVLLIDMQIVYYILEVSVPRIRYCPGFVILSKSNLYISIVCLYQGFVHACLYVSKVCQWFVFSLYGFVIITCSYSGFVDTQSLFLPKVCVYIREYPGGSSCKEFVHVRVCPYSRFVNV